MRLVADVRVFLNQQDSTNSFWSDPELLGYLNDGIRQYFLIVEENGEGQFDPVPVLLDVVSGVSTVAMPTDFFKIRALYRVQTQGLAILSYSNNITTGKSTVGAGSGDSYTPSYYFQGNNIVLDPVPGFDQTGALRLEYTAFPDTMITGQDSMTSGISPIFKELIIAYACYKAKLKESSVTGGATHEAIGTHLAQLSMLFKQTVGGRSRFPQYIKPFTP